MPPSLTPANRLSPSTAALLRSVVAQAVASLDREYYASWHSVRTDPDRVRAKAQALKDLEARIGTTIRELTDGE